MTIRDASHAETLRKLEPLRRALKIMMKRGEYPFGNSPDVQQQENKS